MTSTAPLQLRAERATTHANAARKSRKASSAKQREAVKLTARLVMAENVKERGCHYTREQRRALST